MNTESLKAVHATAERRYADPEDEGNSPKYLTGYLCIEPGCKNLAGTAWSHLWCRPCNVKRMDQISTSLSTMAAQ